MLDGAFTSWHDNGTVKVQATYSKAKIVGTYRGFHPDGSRYTEFEYGTGVIESFRRWHPNGQLQSEFEYRGGQAHGPVREWHPNGQLALSGTQDMGRKDGLWTTWDEHGTKRSEVPWRLGEPQAEVRIFDENGVERTAEGAEERATVNGTYSRLLKTIPAPHDHAHYKDFRDYGWYKSGSSYAGVKDIPPGYWVYSYPNWYVWGDMKGAKPK